MCSCGEILDILEDICIQEMLGYELMDKAEVSYASGASTLSLAVKCANESVQ